MTFSHYDFKYIDAHSHFFPPEIFKAIWRTFEMKDKDGNPRGWTVKYKLSTEDLVKFLESRKIEAFTTLNYAHKKGLRDLLILGQWSLLKNIKMQFHLRVYGLTMKIA